MGAGCREFESLYPDHFSFIISRTWACGVRGDCVRCAKESSLPDQTFHCAEFFDGEQLLTNQLVHMADGRIAAIEAAAAGAATGAEPVELLVPGLIDLQVNGGGGALFNAAPSVETIRTIAAAHRTFGTTGFLPTLISDSNDAISSAIAAVAAAIGQGVPGVLGIHLEGPCLNSARRGVHDAARFVTPTDADVDLFASLRVGRTLVTLAPEVAGNEVIAALEARGVIVSGGHSEADYDTTCAALDAGMRGFTHLFNAMPPLLSRAPGMVGAAIARDDCWFGIIADGHHVHPASLRAAVRAKPRGGALLVTDAMPTVGAPDAAIEVALGEVTLEGGKLTTPDGTLAGSHLDMLSAVNNAARFAGIDWFEALRMGSLYPARALGLDGELGMLRPGYRATCLVLDAQRRLRETWVDGTRRFP